MEPSKTEFSFFRASAGAYPERKSERNCVKHGPYSVREFLGTDQAVIGTIGGCDKCNAEHRAEYDERERLMALSSRINSAKIPERFKLAELAGFDASPQTAEALESAKSFSRRWPEQKRTGESLILIGEVGTGKTHLAVGILKEIVRRGSNGRYCTVSELLREVRATWRGHGERSEQQIVDYFGSVELLVLDEVGATNGSDNERVILFDVLNERYERMFPTIVCGNVNIAELSRALDERSVDRLRENGGKAVVLKGKSHRLQASAGGP